MKIGSLVKIIKNDMSLCFPEAPAEKSDKFFNAIGLILKLDSDISKEFTTSYKYWHIVHFPAGIAVVRVDAMEVII